eukprot:scaffold251125_cov21-Tisochrysis_lutea.AAC.1
MHAVDAGNPDWVVAAGFEFADSKAANKNAKKRANKKKKETPVHDSEPCQHVIIQPETTPSEPCLQGVFQLLVIILSVIMWHEMGAPEPCKVYL